MNFLILAIALIQAVIIGFNLRLGNDVRNLRNKVEMPWFYEEHNGLFTAIKSMQETGRIHKPKIKTPEKKI